MNPYTRYVLPCIIDYVMRGEEHERLRRQLVAEARGRVLEIGIGTGLNLPHYPPSVRRIAAIDPNPGMNARTRRRAEQSGMTVNLQTASAEQLPFDSGSFDTVISTWTLCSIGDIDAAMREIGRVLSNGGSFLFIEHGLAQDSDTLQRWQHRLTPINRVIGGGCRLDRDMRQIIGGALHIEAMETFYLDTMPRLGGFTYRGSAQR